MNTQCIVIKKLKGKGVTEGAGVRLQRIFGYYELPQFDPFLLLDHFESENREDFTAGFPFHPHRGIETITYLKKGEVEHKDKLGNTALLKSGQVQWMKTGSGIYHQEMPGDKEGINGFQLWLNMAAKDKMNPAEYFVFEELPEYSDDTLTARIISGQYRGITGPGTGKNTREMVYLDMELTAETESEHTLSPEAFTAIYIYRGAVAAGDETGKKGEILLLSSGEKITLKAGTEGAGYLLISAKPLKEAIAWWGPVVMNSEEEILQTQKELSSGEFPGS